MAAGNAPDETVNPTAGSILGFLATFGPLTGWEMDRTIAGSIGNFWNVTRSQVYRELRDLAGRGLVTPGAPGPRDRTAFSITDDGREALEAWLAQEPGPDLIRHRLLLTVFFSDFVDPQRLGEILATQRADHEQRLAEYRDLEPTLAAGPMAATLRFGIAYEEMVLAWLDSLA